MPAKLPPMPPNPISNEMIWREYLRTVFDILYTAGTIPWDSVDLPTASAGQFLAGPVSGPDADVTFRAIALADITTALSTWPGSTAITTLGTITTGTWNGTTIAIARGGTGQTTQTAAFDALAPTTTAGDISYYNGTDNIRLPIGTANQRLSVNAGATAPEWQTVSSSSGVDVEDEGTPILTPATTLNFTGSGVVVTDAGGGVADITISSGSGTPGGSSGDWQYNNAGAFGGFTPGTGVQTWVVTPSSANLRSALTDETGTGVAVFSTQPSFTNTIGVGAATASASGSGITFPATQSDSTDVNTLDDYEEGTWTPVIVSSGGGSGTYNFQVGTYTKIGNRVLANCSVQLTSAAGYSAGNITISGLPFTSSSVTQNRSPVNIIGNALTTGNSLTGEVNTSSTEIIPYFFASGSLSLITVANLTNNTIFLIQVTYPI